VVLGCEVMVGFVLCGFLYHSLELEIGFKIDFKIGFKIDSLALNLDCLAL
jgi:hypothetical protein